MKKHFNTSRIPLYCPSKFTFQLFFLSKSLITSSLLTFIWWLLRTCTEKINVIWWEQYLMFPSSVLQMCVCLQLFTLFSILFWKRKCLCSSRQLLPEALDLITFLLKGFALETISPTPVSPALPISLPLQDKPTHILIRFIFTKQKPSSSLDPTSFPATAPGISS